MDTGSIAYGGGSASLELTAEADDGISLLGEDTGASQAVLDEAWFLPEGETWSYLNPWEMYVAVCVPATVDDCTVTVCVNTGYLPREWVDGASHSLTGSGYAVVRGEAILRDLTDGTFTASDPWSGSITVPAFTWRDQDGECLTRFGATSLRASWSLNPEVSRVWPRRFTSCR